MLKKVNIIKFNGKEYLCCKGVDVLMFMSEFQANLLYQYNKYILMDGTFYVALKPSFQIITVRLHEIKEDNFYTIGHIFCLIRRLKVT